MVGSHSCKGNCLDNACIESFFSHLKTETLYNTHYTTKEELFQARFCLLSCCSPAVYSSDSRV